MNPHDISRDLVERIEVGLLGHFTARVLAWDAHICSCRWERDHNRSDWVQPPQYRWTTPEGEERYAPVVTFGSKAIERAFRVAALRGMLAKQGAAP
jgi:hypothetical protein